MESLNLGILAHVDAGKTSLTERLLFEAGAINQLGSVDRGDTQTDTLAVERERGITVRSAVVSFEINDRSVNLIDTPGHPDFIAEVERVLRVLDGAVVVISAVEGVQPQTRILMRALQRLGIPRLLFINKIDRRGAQGDPLLGEVRRTLGLNILPMGVAFDLGSRGADVTGWALDDPDHQEQVIEALALHNEALLRQWAGDDQRHGAGGPRCSRSGTHRAGPGGRPPSGRALGQRATCSGAGRRKIERPVGVREVGNRLDEALGVLAGHAPIISGGCIK
jgi:ribosomal protection tetracycline resistance protein